MFGAMFGADDGGGGGGGGWGQVFFLFLVLWDVVAGVCERIQANGLHHFCLLFRTWLAYMRSLHCAVACCSRREGTGTARAGRHRRPTRGVITG